MSAKTKGGLLVLDRAWRADEFTMVRGDLLASVRIVWCSNDSGGRNWRWHVERMAEGRDNVWLADGRDCTLEEAKAHVESVLANTPDLAVYRFAGLESPGATP